MDYKKWDKSIDQEEKLDDEILELSLEIARLRKQKRHWLKVRKELGDLEAKNILELEEDEVREGLEKEQQNAILAMPSSSANGSPFDLSLDESFLREIGMCGNLEVIFLLVKLSH